MKGGGNIVNYKIFLRAHISTTTRISEYSLCTNRYYLILVKFAMQNCHENVSTCAKDSFSVLLWLVKNGRFCITYASDLQSDLCQRILKDRECYQKSSSERSHYQRQGYRNIPCALPSIILFSSTNSKFFTQENTFYCL
jgi:hypothetical protein